MYHAVTFKDTSLSLLYFNGLIREGKVIASWNTIRDLFACANQHFQI